MAPGQLPASRPFPGPMRSSLLLLVGGGARRAHLIGRRGLLPQARIGRRASPSGLLPQPRVGRRSDPSDQLEGGPDELVLAEGESQPETAVGAMSDAMETLMAG